MKPKVKNMKIDVDKIVKKVIKHKDKYVKDWRGMKKADWRLIAYDFDIGEGSAKKVKLITEQKLG